ncbi:hemerythrin domain-containing protein [Amycolatopsis cynarae]|uniref:Hemerythrin domain-containing protein n=1 Tax=Amycolatopsis cynarae TaxID=2995223 RepID=A0ABY7AYC1_9PSEU|nr:hemerythrin domain-containing protein [Amycolatopsis sp. HUAS 11-8]WAL63937.1 hemerythrin domain-containing protein [Amycolatopsis sp. HUAS 11-8]
MAQQKDVVALLRQQHQEIRRLFGELETATGTERTESFRNLVRLLSVHETAEEELVHPEVRKLPGGDKVVEARLGEERRAKELLATLDDMGPEAEGFDTLLRELREDVLAHAAHEERQEFPMLHKGVDEKRRIAMADTVRAAEAIAPTHPHPGVEGAAANVVLGTPVAIMDRVRDAIRKAVGG